MKWKDPKKELPQPYVDVWVARLCGNEWYISIEWLDKAGNWWDEPRRASGEPNDPPDYWQPLEQPKAPPLPKVKS